MRKTNFQFKNDWKIKNAKKLNFQCKMIGKLKNERKTREMSEEWAKTSETNSPHKWWKTESRKKRAFSCNCWENANILGEREMI